MGRVDSGIDRGKGVAVLSATFIGCQIEFYNKIGPTICCHYALYSKEMLFLMEMYLRIHFFVQMDVVAKKLDFVEKEML